LLLAVEVGAGQKMAHMGEMEAVSLAVKVKAVLTGMAIFVAGALEAIRPRQDVLQVKNPEVGPLDRDVGSMIWGMVSGRLEEVMVGGAAGAAGVLVVEEVATRFPMARS